MFCGPHFDRDIGIRRGLHRLGRREASELVLECLQDVAALRQSRRQIRRRERAQLDLHRASPLGVEVLDRIEIIVSTFDPEPEGEHFVDRRTRCGVHRQPTASLERRRIRRNAHRGHGAEINLGAIDASCELERRVHALHFMLVGGGWIVAGGKRKLDSHELLRPTTNH